MGKGSACPEGGSAQLWGSGAGRPTPAKPPPPLCSPSPPLGIPYKPFEPQPAASRLASRGGAPGRPQMEGGPRPVPDVCLQVSSAPHKLVSQDFSTQNTSPREATGLMSWACGRSHPALLVPPQSCPAVRGLPRRTRRAWDGAQDPSACSSGLRVEPRSQQDPDPHHGRSPITPASSAQQSPGFTLTFPRTLPSLLSPSPPCPFLSISDLTPRPAFCP